MTYKKSIGSIGEKLAIEILLNKGYRIIKRNFNCPYGEIDVIAVKGRKISFVEVKTRTTLQYGSPCEAVNWYKQRHIRNAAKYFLSSSKYKYEEIDFHVIEITANHICGLSF